MRISECNKTVSEARSALKEKISRSISASKVESYSPLLCLLDELTIRPCLPFHAVFEEYASKVAKTSGDVKSTRAQFRDLVLQKDGLPVIITRAGNDMYVLLLEKPIDNISLCKGINSILEESIAETTKDTQSLLYLASLFPMMKKLLSSAIDCAVVYCILSLLLSRTNMKMLFGINESFSSRTQSEITQLALLVEKKEEEPEKVRIEC